MRTLAVLIALSLAPPAARALPVTGSAQPVAGLVVWRDSDDESLFYYAPGDLRLARRPDGGPEATLFVVRYQGDTLGGDPERAFVRSSLTAEMEMTPPTAAALGRVASELGGAARRPVRVLPMPIHRIKTVLVFTPVDTAVPPSTFADGFLEPKGEEAGGAFWRRRAFTVFLSRVDAQLLLTALREGGAVMSLSCEFTTRAQEPPPSSPVTSGGPLAGTPPPPGEAPTRPAPKEQTVAASAVPIAVDTARFPDRVVLLDLGATSPPGYPVLSVYCFDFSEGVDPEAFEKTVELEGSGLHGGPVAASVTFRSDAPDVTRRSVRFGFPVRTDRPFRQRVSTTYWSGEERRTAWSAPADWVSVLDVTAPH